METRNIAITLEKAKEWYKSNDSSLKEMALQAFTKEELEAFDFTTIKTFEDVINVLNEDHQSVVEYDRLTQMYNFALLAYAKLRMSKISIIFAMSNQ